MRKKLGSVAATLELLWIAVDKLGRAFEDEFLLPVDLDSQISRLGIAISGLD